jgi:hypothetical protein
MARPVLEPLNYEMYNLELDGEEAIINLLWVIASVSLRWRSFELLIFVHVWISLSVLRVAFGWVHELDRQQHFEFYSHPVKPKIKSQNWSFIIASLSGLQFRILCLLLVQACQRICDRGRASSYLALAEECNRVSQNVDTQSTSMSRAGVPREHRAGGLEASRRCCPLLNDQAYSPNGEISRVQYMYMYGKDMIPGRWGVYLGMRWTVT